MVVLVVCADAVVVVRVMRADAVEQDGDDLIGGEQVPVRDQLVRTGEGEQPQQPRHLLYRVTEQVLVRFQQPDHRRGDALVDRVVATPVLVGVLRRPVHAERQQQVGHGDQPVLHDRGQLGQPFP
ncbi:hypothetical protein [Micromonospora zhanjiangensis]